MRSHAASVPRLVRGSVFVHSRRCGNRTCHCAGGETFHKSTVLSYSEKGPTRVVMLPADLTEPVRAATERYRAERQRLEERGSAGLAELTASLAAARKAS